MHKFTKGCISWLYLGELSRAIQEFNKDNSLMTELLPQLCEESLFRCIMNQCFLSHLKYIQLCMPCTEAAG